MAGAKKPKKLDKKRPIIVVGGGPAGMTAAQAAIKYYNNVILFDKNPEAGKKLQSILSDCAFVSEELPYDKIARAFGDHEDFVKPALKAFGWKQLSSHLASMGIKLTSNGTSHLIISPGTSGEVAQRLKQAAETAGVIIRKSSKVSDILFSGDVATGVVVNSVEYSASSVIIACGSAASPARGATINGYEFARKAGHSINRIRPALVGLETEEKYGKLLDGAEFRDCRMEVTKDEQLIFSDRGGIQFTSYGVGGDLILTHSARIIELLGDNKSTRHAVRIHVDMIPNIKKKELETWVAQEISSSPKITVGELFEKNIPEKLRNVMSRVTRIHSEKPIANLSSLERKMLLLWVKDFHLTIKRPRPFNETMGVLGGVPPAEVDSGTMRSLKKNNLYFAGDVMDLPGPWGGYNLQLAFSTGNLAGMSAAKSLVES